MANFDLQSILGSIAAGVPWGGAGQQNAALNGSQSMARDLQRFADRLSGGARGVSRDVNTLMSAGWPFTQDVPMNPGYSEDQANKVLADNLSNRPEWLGLDTQVDTRNYAVDDTPSIIPADTSLPGAPGNQSLMHGDVYDLLTRLNDAKLGGMGAPPSPMTSMEPGAMSVPGSSPQMAQAGFNPVAKAHPAARTPANFDIAGGSPQLDEMASLGADLRAMTARMKAGLPAGDVPPPAPASAQVDPIADIPVGNRMTPSRRWSGMDGQPGGGLEADPLGATRMSQPVIGGIPATDANDARRAGEADKYNQELEMLKALDARAAPLWSDLPSNADAARKLLMQRGSPGAPDADVYNHMALNMNNDPLGRYGQGSPVAKMGNPGDRKYDQGYLMDKADRSARADSRAAAKGLDRQDRMGRGDAIANQQMMGLMQALGNQGGGGGGQGGFINPMLARMLNIPGVDEFNRNVAQQQDFDARNAAIEVQREQLDSLKETRAGEQRAAAAGTRPNPGSIASQIYTAFGKVGPEDVKMHAENLLKQRYTPDRVRAMLVGKTYGFDQALVDQVLPPPAAPAPSMSQPQGDPQWAEKNAKMLQDMQIGPPPGFQFRGGF